MKIIFLDIDGVVNCWDTKECAPSKYIMVQTSFDSGIKPGAVKMAIDILAKEGNPYGNAM